MPQFKPNVPIVQDDPLVKVDVTRNKPMPAGKYVFQLVVVDDGGNESDPANIEVIIRDTQRPTAVIEMVDANKAKIKPVVSVGKSFMLSAAKSTDVPPGKIKAYRFTLLDQG
ncbi:MAG: hypothetical protein AAF583_00550 [Pseudomonadota bacterium]